MRNVIGTDSGTMWTFPGDLGYAVNEGGRTIHMQERLRPDWEGLIDRLRNLDSFPAENGTTKGMC